MRKVFTYVALFASIVLLSNCKKGLEPGPGGVKVDSLASLSDNVTPNKVVTIAGLANSPGFTDGLGSIARFNSPSGIQLLKDGSLYVADRYNNAIRKISPDGKVTTEQLKPDPSGGFNIIQPLYVGEDDKRNLNVICYKNNDSEPYSEAWVFDTKRSFIARASTTYVVKSCLAKDPYEDVFWFSSGYSIVKYVATSPYDIGIGPSYYEAQFFDEFTERGNSLKGLFVGRNKVIYFSAGSRLFKHTPGGIDTQIDSNLALGVITSIVLNGDSKTIYLAAGGYIERIVNGKLTKLAGPNITNPDGRDGIGFKADVNANSLALGDHENSLYFSDTKTHTIRKLMLN